jgi:hypothetical protein
MLSELLAISTYIWRSSSDLNTRREAMNATTIQAGTREPLNRSMVNLHRCMTYTGTPQRTLINATTRLQVDPR